MRSTRLMGSVFALGVGLALTLGITVRGGIAAPAAEGQAPRMSTEQTEATLSAYADALLSGGPYDTFFAEDVVVTAVGSGNSVTGRGEAKTWLDEFHHETFDAHSEVMSMVIGEGQAAIEAMFVATQTGEFAGIVPTGRHVAVRYGVFYELADGKITSLRIYGLADGLVQQLTAPAPTESTRYRPGQPR